MAGRIRATTELRAALAEVHSKTPDFLDGAWELLDGSNPVATELVADCVVEALDRILREAAPDDGVESWLPSSGIPQKNWYSEKTGKLTRPARIRYIAAQRSTDRELVLPLADACVAAAARLGGKAQGIKHASAGDLLTARSLLHAVEATLAVLFI